MPAREGVRRRNLEYGQGRLSRVMRLARLAHRFLGRVAFRNSIRDSSQSSQKAVLHLLDRHRMRSLYWYPFPGKEYCAMLWSCMTQDVIARYAVMQVVCGFSLARRVIKTSRSKAAVREAQGRLGKAEISRITAWRCRMRWTTKARGYARQVSGQSYRCL